MNRYIIEYLNPEPYETPHRLLFVHVDVMLYVIIWSVLVVPMLLMDMLAYVRYAEKYCGLGKLMLITFSIKH